MRRWVALIAVAAASGYAGNAVASSTSHTEWDNRPEPYAMTYLGRTLVCLVTEDGSEAGHIGGLSCDFVRYWRRR